MFCFGQSIRRNGKNPKYVCSEKVSITILTDNPSVAKDKIYTYLFQCFVDYIKKEILH